MPLLMVRYKSAVGRVHRHVEVLSLLTIGIKDLKRRGIGGYSRIWLLDGRERASGKTYLEQEISGQEVVKLSTIVLKAAMALNQLKQQPIELFIKKK